VKSLKTLEDLAVFLSTAILSLTTLHNTQVRAIEIGIMKEDMNERANTIAWDLRRLIKLYEVQLVEVLELLPEGFTPQETVEKLQKGIIKKVKSKTKKLEP
jgi:hypothetical protein